MWRSHEGPEGTTTAGKKAKARCPCGAKGGDHKPDCPMATVCESWKERVASRVDTPAGRVALAAAGVLTLELAAAVLWRRRAATRRRSWRRWA